MQIITVNTDDSVVSNSQQFVIQVSLHKMKLPQISYNWQIKSSVTE